MKRLRVLLPFLTIFTISAGWAQENNTLTYEEAVSIALRENLQIQQQQNILRTAEVQRSQAYAQFLPEVGISANAQRQIGRAPDPNTLRLVDATSNFLSTGISAELIIFNGFANINQLKQAQAMAENQFYIINSTKQEVMFNVSQRYLQVLLNQELLRIAEANLEQQQEQLESVRTFVESGTQYNIADLYNQEAETQRVALTVVEAENQLTISKASLTRILQIDPFKDWTFTEPSVEQIELLTNQINLEEAYNEAIQQRPDLMQQQKLIDANRYSVKVANAGFFPRLVAGYNYGSRYSSNDPDFSFEEQLTEANLSHSFYASLYIPIFQNFQNRTLVQRSRQVLSNSELTLEDLERNVFEQLQTAVADYRAAQQRVVSAEAQVKAAEKALEAEQERFRLGVSNVIDLNLVNATFVEAQATQVQADYQLIFQKTALDYYTGKLQTGAITE
ncbi:MAG: TolC family protein [Cyclobacteriaceae bacterium]